MASFTFDPSNKAELELVRSLFFGTVGAALAPTQQVVPQQAQPAIPAAPAPAPAPVQPVMPTAPAPAAVQPVMPSAPAPAAPDAGTTDADLQGLVQRLVQAQLPNVGVPQILGILQGLGAATISALVPEKRMEFRNQILALSGGMVQ